MMCKKIEQELFIIDKWGNKHIKFPQTDFYVVKKTDFPFWSIDDKQLLDYFIKLLDFPVLLFFKDFDNYHSAHKSINEYYLLNSHVKPIIDLNAGITPESITSRNDFSKAINTIPIEKKEVVFRLLYVDDFRDYINFTQNILCDIENLVIEFYSKLYDIKIKTEKISDIFPNDCLECTGHEIIFVLLESIFQKIGTLLDFSVKLCDVLSFRPKDYLLYYKLSHGNMLWSDRKKLKNIDFSPIELTQNIDLIINLRNDFTHNRSWEAKRKVYCKTNAKGKVIKSWIYLHDFSKGIQDTFVNRQRFYSQGEKINEILPEVLSDFYKGYTLFIGNIISKIQNELEQ